MKTINRMFSFESGNFYMMCILKRSLFLDPSLIKLAFNNVDHNNYYPN